MKKSVKRGCAAAFMLLVGLPLLLILFVTMWIRARDVDWPEPMPGVRIEPALRPLAADEITETNAYYYLRKRAALEPEAGLHPDPERGFAAEQERERYEEHGWEDGAYTNLVPVTRAALAPALPLLRQAAETPFCQVERFDFDKAYPVFTTCLEDVKALCLLAHHHAAQGEWEEAATRLELGLRISSQLSRGGALIAWLVACAGHQVVQDAVLYMDEVQGLPPAMSRRLAAALRAEAEAMMPIAESLRHEFASSRRMTATVLSGGAPAALLTGQRIPRAATAAARLFGSGPKRSTAHLDALYSYLVGYAESGGTDEEALAVVEDFLDGIRRRGPGLFLSDDPLGRLLAAIMVPAVGKAVEREGVLLERIDLVETMLALRRAARAADGAPPPALEALVPGQLERLPPHLRYRVGEDGSWRIWIAAPGAPEGAAPVDLRDTKATRKAGEQALPALRSDYHQRRRAEADEATPDP